MTLTIKTNNVQRPVLDSCELTEKEKCEFDYLPWEQIDKGEDSASFFRFKGQVYDLSQFMYARKAFGFSEWDGYFSDSAFSGVLVRYCNNNESLIVATYYS